VVASEKLAQRKNVGLFFLAPDLALCAAASGHPTADPIGI
jgi:hypothetical protein